MQEVFGLAPCVPRLGTPRNKSVVADPAFPCGALLECARQERRFARTWRAADEEISAGQVVKGGPSTGSPAPQSPPYAGVTEKLMTISQLEEAGPVQPRQKLTALEVVYTLRVDRKFLQQFR